MKRGFPFLALILVLLAAVPATAMAAPTGWQWPTSVTGLSQGFSSGHTGVDIAVPIETALYAVQDGTIVKVYKGCNHHSGRKKGTTCKSANECAPNHGYSAGSNSYGYCNNGYGNGICLRTTDGYYVQLAHMNSVSASLYEGQYVTKGTFLGYSGDTGSSTGPHCHYSVSTGGEFSGFINPMSVTYGSGDPCETYGCSDEYAGYYRCTSKDGLNINSGHNYASTIGFIPANEIVWVSKKAKSATYTHVTYNSVSGIASSNYLEKVDSYSLSFNDNGGSGGPGTLTVWNGVSDNSSVSTPTRANYTFNGWYTASSGGTRVYDSNGYCVNEGAYWKSGKYVRGAGATLYAQWTLNYVYVTGVEMGSESETLYVGESVTLDATVKPANATNKSLIWTSSDESVAVVSDSGRVTAKGLGQNNAGACVITAKSADNSGISAICTVFVLPNVENIALNRNSERLSLEYPFNRAQLTACLTPQVDKPVNWSSSDPSVAVVDSRGLVTAKGEGRAVITACVQNGPSDSCIVNVVPKMSRLALPADTASVEAEAFAGVNAEIIVLPSGCEAVGDRAFANNPSLRYAYIPDSVWRLGDDVFAGDSALTIVCSEDKRADMGDIPCVTDEGAAYVSVRSLAINPPTLQLVMDDLYTLECAVLPEKASNRAVTWSSDHPSVVTVDENGKLYAANPGTATITATSVDGGKTATCVVTVQKPDVKVNIVAYAVIPSDQSVEVAAELEIIGGFDVDAGVILLSSAGEELFRESAPNGRTGDGHPMVYCNTASSDLRLSPNTEYGVRFWASVRGNEFESDIVPFVTAAPIPRIILSENSISLRRGRAATLTAEVQNCDASEILWSTDNSSVATVVDGEITANGVGTATVTARLLADSSVTASCTVTVRIW